MTQITSEKILDVAQTLIAAGGYNGFSYADISDAIGIRKASIHHHFPTKAQLVSVLLQRYAKQAEDGLNSVSANLPNPIDQLQAYFDHWRSCITKASEPFCICAMLASEMELLPEDVASHVRRHFENLGGWLASVLKAGSKQELFKLGGTPENEAQILMASVHGAMLSARALGKPEIFAAIIAPQLARLTA